MTERKKILIVPRNSGTLTPDFKGHAYHENFYPRLSKHFDLTIVSSAIENTALEDGIKFHYWNFRKPDNKIKLLREALKGLLSLLNIVSKEKPDVILSESPYLKGVFAGIIGKIKGIASVVRMGGARKDNIPKRILRKISFGLADKVVVVSKTSKREMMKDCPEDKIEIIYPGTDFPEELPEVEKSDKTIVGYLGRFHKRKGTDRFIDLVKTFNPPNIEYRIAGWGDYKKDEIEKMDEEGKINYLGKLPSDQVFEYLNNLDVLVAPSRTEGSPRVVVESLGVGTPVLAWDIPAMREIIKDSKFLVSNFNEMKNKIGDLKKKKIDISWFNREKYSAEKEHLEYNRVLKNV